MFERDRAVVRVGQGGKKREEENNSANLVPLRSYQRRQVTTQYQVKRAL